MYVLEALKEAKGKCAGGCWGYFWPRCSHYLLCLFVSIIMFTAMCKRIATKLGYDELLSWRENWMEQGNIWDLRCCVLLEVTCRCLDKEGETQFPENKQLSRAQST